MAEHVHLLAGNPPGPVGEVADARRIAEFPSPGTPGLWHRFLRTEDRDPVTGFCVYVSIGTRGGPRSACPTCAEPRDLYTHRLADNIAQDLERHAELLRCRDCGDLYECFPEELAAPRRVSVSEARAAFAGAM